MLSNDIMINVQYILVIDKEMLVNQNKTKLKSIVKISTRQTGLSIDISIDSD